MRWSSQAILASLIINSACLNIYAPCLAEVTPQPELQPAVVPNPASTHSWEPNDSNGQRKIEELTKQILLQLIQIERLNTEFRIASLKDDKWRGWRQFGYTMQNSSLTEASQIINMKLRYGFIKKPPVINNRMTRRRPLEVGDLTSTQIPSLVGNSIGTAAPIFELGVNTRKYLHDRKRGLTPGPVRAHISQDLEEIDNLLKRRAALISTAGFNKEQLEFIETETDVLHNIRDLADLQSKRYYLHAKKFSSFQISAYLIDVLKNSTGMVSNIIAINGIQERRPRLGGTANIFTTISGAATLAIPVGSRLYAKLVYEYYRRKKFPELATFKDAVDKERAMMDAYEKNLHRLVLLAKKENIYPYEDGMNNRIYVYAHQNVLFSNQEEVMLREIRQDLNTTLETYVVAGTAGNTKITSGILGMIADYKYYNKPIIANKLSAVGSTVYGAGTGAQMLEVIASKARQQLTQRKLGAKHTLPSELRQQRLELLSIMQNRASYQ